MQPVSPLRTYLASKIAFCRIVLVACKCWDIEEFRLVVRVDMIVENHQTGNPDGDRITDQ